MSHLNILTVKSTRPVGVATKNSSPRAMLIRCFGASFEGSCSPLLILCNR